MTILVALFWIAVILAIIGAVLMKQKVWAPALLYWSLIAAVVLLGVQTNLIAFLRPALTHTH